ncbi:MAG TPA: hypothetical protein VF765_05545 [Polyangiaceae bacterium]
MVDDTITYDYYAPSGALFAEIDDSNGTFFRYGPCSFNAAALACNRIVDAGCASGDGQAPDGGSPDSAAD